MVKKLIKYEVLSFFRTIIPIQLILLGIALLNRLIQFFESDSVPYGIIFTSSIIVYVIAIIVCIIMTTVVVITRFYKNLYTVEGYLSFTLPVKKTSHISAKLISSLIVSIMSAISVFLSFLIVTAGSVCVEIFKAAGYLLKKLFEEFGGNAAWYIVEAILLCLAAIVAQYLLFYACITVGQMSRKNKILAAFGVFFGYYIVNQIISTIIIIIVNMSDIGEKIVDFMDNHMIEAIHIGLCSGIIISLVLACICYFVTRVIMNKRLNLE